MKDIKLRRTLLVVALMTSALAIIINLFFKDDRFEVLLQAYSIACCLASVVLILKPVVYDGVFSYYGEQKLLLQPCISMEELRKNKGAFFTYKNEPEIRYSTTILDDSIE